MDEGLTNPLRRGLPGTAVPWNRPFHVMAKPIGARCNLACSYCFYLEKEAAFYGSAQPSRMSPATLEKFVRDYIASQPGPEITFAWQGGEPMLMGIAFFERAVRLQKEYAAGRSIANAFQTNGTLMDAQWAEFFARENFLVGISLDGPREMHDPYRLDRGGKPTWGRVMDGLRLLRSRQVRFNTLTVVHRRNCRRAGEVYRFLREEGSAFMQFIPLVERAAGAHDATTGLDHARPPAAGHDLLPPEAVERAVPREVPGRHRFGEFLCDIFDLWMQGDVGRVYIQQFESALASWLGIEATLCTMARQCGRALALEHNGDLYLCDHYVYPEYKVGNLHATPLADLGNAYATERFGAAKANLSNACLSCPVRFACNGDCPKHRFVAAGPGQPGISYLCPSYQHFFGHIRPVMERMAALVHAGRSAAEVMLRHR